MSPRSEISKIYTKLDQELDLDLVIMPVSSLTINFFNETYK